MASSGWRVKALAENRLIVEPTLAGQLEPFTSATRLGFLDFETIARALPVWAGMAPWQQAAAQFSYHERQPDGTYTHSAFLAEGPGDARPPLARAMVTATANADRVATYTSFEKTRIRELQRAVPELARELAALEAKLIDLHPVTRDCVYHPGLSRLVQPQGHPHAARAGWAPAREAHARGSQALEHSPIAWCGAFLLPYGMLMRLHACLSLLNAGPNGPSGRGAI